MTNKPKDNNITSNRHSYMKAKATASIDYTMLPKKIIKALFSYKAQEEHEISFEKGDFFHVVGRENDSNWYVAFNPLSNKKGLVPVNYFEVVVKNTLNYIQPNDYPEQKDNARNSIEQHYYGVVLYDFHAERLDELDAKAGEPIIVIAQSNLEWYVAKYIGRLGGPGLIPVSFVQLHDVVTNNAIFPNSNMATSTSSPNRLSARIPNLVEWKKMNQIYEASSISLNGTPLSKNRYSSTTVCSHFSTYSSHPTVQKQHPMSPPLSVLSEQDDDNSDHIYPSSDKQQKQPDHEGLTLSYLRAEKKNHSIVKSQKSQSLRDSQSIIKVINITVDSYVMEEGQYSFILFANINNGKYRVLYRTYEDFYSFHILLMKDYPDEGGKGNQPRIIPYLPGPLDAVDEKITKQRRKDLDKYCKHLLTLPLYISENKLIQSQLLGLKQKDLEIEYDPQKGVISSTKNDDEPTMYKNTNHYTNDGGAKVKIKIVYKDDIFAVKIPADCNLQELKLRIKDRLGALGRMKYKNGTHGGEYFPLETDNDMENAFILAIQRGKLTIFVD